MRRKLAHLATADVDPKALVAMTDLLSPPTKRTASATSGVTSAASVRRSATPKVNEAPSAFASRAGP